MWTSYEYQNKIVTKLLKVVTRENCKKNYGIVGNYYLLTFICKFTLCSVIVEWSDIGFYSLTPKIEVRATLYCSLALIWWSHYRVPSTDSKVRTTLYSIINSTIGNYCSVALIWWSRCRVPFTDSKVRAAMYHIINSTTGKKCPTAFTWMFTFEDYIHRLNS